MISKPLLMGTIMAFVDLLILGMLKARYNQKIKTNWVFLLAFIIYGLQPLLFYKALSFSNMTIMNIIWDLTSDILVAIMGYFVFKETLTPKQKIGFGFGLISLFLLK